MAGKKGDDPYMEWMDDAEYLAYADSVNGSAPAAPVEPAAPMAEPPPLTARCRACERLAAEAKEPPVGDGAGRWWHRECARQALARVATAHARSLCPACGTPPPERGFLFDGAARKWHVDARCTGRVLAGL